MFLIENKLKKIGLFLDSHPYGGGTFQYNQAMLRAILSLSQERFKVVVGYMQPFWSSYLEGFPVGKIKIPCSAYDQLAAKTWRISGLPLGWWRELSVYCNSVSKTLIKENCDLWIFPGQDAWSYQVKVSSLATIHDLMHRYEKRFPEVSAKGRFWRRERHYINMCSWVKGILVDSEVGRLHVHESYGFPKDKIHVLPFVPPQYIYKHSCCADFDLKYKIPSKYIFYPAQFWEHKNHCGLVKAISIVREELNDIQLILVGSPKNAYRNVVKLVKTLNLEDCVHFMGYVPEKDMPEFYHRARAMVMPTFLGPTNIPQLEAFVLGCPTATSKIYGIPEQVGEAALLFNPESVMEIADAIKRLWTDDNLCNLLAEKGKKKAAGWGPPHFEARLLDIIQKII